MNVSIRNSALSEAFIVSLPLTPSLAAVPVPEVNEIEFKWPLFINETPESKMPYGLTAAKILVDCTGKSNKSVNLIEKKVFFDNTLIELKKFRKKN